MGEQDDDMKIPEPWTCGDCVNLKRCTMLFSVKPTNTVCDFAPHRFQLDAVGVLARLVEEAGATLTLYGQPVTGDELRAFTTTIAKAKIAAALSRG